MSPRPLAILALCASVEAFEPTPRAAPGPASFATGGCASTEYCCPDAKHCLTPTATSCAANGDCAGGDVCCPLTKLCVAVGVPCASPCEDQGSYCCPDAKHCLTPTRTACAANGDCTGGDVCCPLTKLCVAVGATCDPSVENTIPTVVLSDGVRLPMAGLGTWQYNDSVAEEAVTTALGLGYSHIDTAFIYRNAAGIGRGLAASKRERSSYFITSKVMGGNASTTFAQHKLTLAQLGVKYVDLLLVHFPAAFIGGKMVGSRAMRQAQWKAMEELVSLGLARSIGVSHYCKTHLQDVLDIATIKPSVNQVQYHVGMGPEGPRGNDDMSFDKASGVLYQSFSPLCGPCGGTKELISGPLVTKIGAAHNKSGAQVSLKWLVQQGIPVIPKSVNPTHLKENLDLFDWQLTDAEMKALSAAASPPVGGSDTPGTSGDCTIP